MTVDSLIINIIEKFFDTFGIKYSQHEKIYMLLLRYFNFRLKYIVLTPREIRVSEDLSGKLLTHPLRDTCFDIFYKTIKGYDINPHQSRESFNSDYHDGLFNDWGIHHLHLSSEKKSTQDFFLKRTGELLFVRFTDSIAYFLDIQNHNRKNIWSNTDFIRIIQKNWPDSIADKEVSNVKWNPDFNDEEIGQLRQKGYLFGINVDDKSYLFLGHGQASSGDNFMASKMAGEVLRWLGKNSTLFSTNKTLFTNQIRKQLYID